MNGQQMPPWMRQNQQGRPQQSPQQPPPQWPQQQQPQQWPQQRPQMPQQQQWPQQPQQWPQQQPQMPQQRPQMPQQAPRMAPPGVGRPQGRLPSQKKKRLLRVLTALLILTSLVTIATGVYFYITYVR